MSSQEIGFNDVLHGAVAGMIGGAVGSWVMNQYIAAQQPREQKPAQSGEQGEQRQSSQQSREAQQAQKGAANQEDDATVKTAQAISRGLFEHDLTPQEKKIAGPAVHYGYGALVGGLYGGLAEVWAPTSAGFGMAYGVALWALGDEAAVPSLGLGPPPTQVPARKHADFLAAHIVFGIALDVTRRFARHIV